MFFNQYGGLLFIELVQFTALKLSFSGNRVVMILLLIFTTTIAQS